MNYIHIYYIYYIYICLYNLFTYITYSYIPGIFRIMLDMCDGAFHDNN